MEAGNEDAGGIKEAENSKADRARKLPVEVFFLRYAFPCAFAKLGRNEITERDYNELETAAREGFVLARPRLEKIFSSAFYYINTLAKRMEKDKWDYDVIEEYFLNMHNHIIDKGEGVYATATKTLKDLSRVKTGEIIQKKDDILKIKFDDSERSVLNHLVPSAKIGDKVRVHFGYAVEIV